MICKDRKVLKTIVNDIDEKQKRNLIFWLQFLLLTIFFLFFCTLYNTIYPKGICYAYIILNGWAHISHCSKNATGLVSILGVAWICHQVYYKNNVVQHNVSSPFCFSLISSFKILSPNKTNHGKPMFSKFSKVNVAHKILSKG